jgi:hypothetical protein
LAVSSVDILIVGGHEIDRGGLAEDGSADEGWP